MTIMEHTLTLEVPEEVYEPLAETARQRGSTPEELAVELLMTAIHYATNDPVDNFIGAFRSSVPDWADQHDTYLGQAVMKSIHDAGDEGP
ncbi:MAG: hypothetical protein M5U01_15605 [Ardenticatenaceae bacterium]|nr:hypothetical protein [Ardenticatenaceae bacterium]